jgi:hypothetical protein
MREGLFGIPFTHAGVAVEAPSQDSRVDYVIADAVAEISTTSGVVDRRDFDLFVRPTRIKYHVGATNVTPELCRYSLVHFSLDFNG